MCDSCFYIIIRVYSKRDIASLHTVPYIYIYTSHTYDNTNKIHFVFDTNIISRILDCLSS